MLKILSKIYLSVVNTKNYLYDRELLKIRKVEDCKVVCIGNVTVGGTGKTPAVQYFTRRFLAEGKKVAIISRGYKGVRKEDPLVVSDGTNILVSEKESGDEAFFHASVLKVPVVVGKDRYSACKLATDRFDIDTIILDDGFQHRKLYRDRNILLIDATNPFGGNELLPFGRLREPIKEIRRAHEIIITKTGLVEKEVVDEILSVLKKYNKKTSLSDHKPSLFYDVDRKEYNLDIIRNKRVLLVSGIANPENFEKTVRLYSPKMINRIDFKDHSEYGEKEIEQIDKALQEEIDYLVTTEKDFVKLKKIMSYKKLLILKIEFDIIGEN